jgi:hypothetical protein
MPARKRVKKATAKKSARRTAAKKAGKKASRKGATSGIGQAPPGFFLINMIPQSLSGETGQDSEPHLTVNPANPNIIIGTAFSPNPGGGALGPVYKSLNGGATWVVAAIVPSQAGSALGTGDITTSFNRTGTKLYGGILRAGTGALTFLRTTVPAFPPMTILNPPGRPSADQPFTHATTVTSGVGAGQDRVYIGDNDFAAPGGKTQTIDQSLNAGVGPPTAFNSVRVEKRATVSQDGPQCRPVAHADGTVYAAFYGWRALTGSFPANTLVITSADVVVVRDDKWGTTGFVSLKEPPAPLGDGLAGVRVIKRVSFPFMRNGTAPTGQQRIGGTISIAVDPNNSNNVFLAFGAKALGSFLTIHVRRSTNRGVTWSNDLLSIPNATNAALAINSAGVVGLLYQQVTGTGAAQRWVTHFRRSGNGGVTWIDLVLATVPATTPVKTFDPYIGDYDHLVAVGPRFYGIFSTNNTPNMANFPNGVVYQRNANFVTHTLLNVNKSGPVAPSIDPFFFKL